MPSSMNGKSTTPQGEISPQEKSRIEKSVRGLEQAPSSRQQLGAFTNWRAIQDALGQPFNNERVPLSKLKLMRRDSMLAFGMHYQKMAKVKAPWYMECPDPQIAAFMDGTLRPIIASLIIAEEQKKDFGFQAIAKRFQLAAPEGQYLDPKTGKEQLAWNTQGGIEPITLKPFVALPPEGVEPIFDEATGEFAGIKYKPPQGSAPSVGGAKAKGSGGSSGEVEIDLYHCQPAGELVLTFNRGYVPIEELDPDSDSLVVWDKKQKIIRRHKGFSFKKTSRSYSGDLLDVQTESGSTRVTPNHKFTVRWTDEALEKWAVYLMRKGDWWRIGMTRLVKGTDRKASGIGQRVSAEGADAAWILDLFDTKNEALYHEKLWGSQYKISDMIFKYDGDHRSEHCLTTDQIESIWQETSSETSALQLLADKGRDPAYPFYAPDPEVKRITRGLRGWTCHAANMIPGAMEIPVDLVAEDSTAVWKTITEVERSHYEDDVFSIDVPPHHHYIVNGLITQNSLWVTNEIESVFGNLFGYPRLAYAYPYWWSYWFRWAIADRAFEKKGDPPIVVRHPEGTIDLGKGEEIQNQDYALLMAERLRAGAAVALPSQPYTNFEDRPSAVPEWAIEYLKGGVEMEAFDSSFEYMDVMKLRAIFVPEQALIEGGGGTSSRNVAEEMFEGLVEGQTMDMNEIVESVNRWIIPHLMLVNFPQQYEQGITCRMKVQGFTSTDTELLSQIIQLVGQADPAELGIDVRAALKQLGIPLLSQEKYEENLKAAAEKAAAEGPPEVAPTSTASGVVPTSGKRPSTAANTGRTQTGGSFTGFSADYMYVPPCGLGIDLSATTEAAASFMAALPAIPAYEDASMRALSKRLWNAMEKLYRTSYAEFEDYLKEQEQIQLTDEQLEMDFAISDIAREIGRKVVNSWPGNIDLLDETTSVLTDIVERMMNRASEITRKEAGLESRMSEQNIKDWVSNHVADLVPNSILNLREELAEFVGKSFHENEGPIEGSELAKMVNAQYSNFPKWMASRFSRAETRDAFNAATLLTGRDNGIVVAQAMDALGGSTDRHCEERDGQLFPIDAALQEEEHPSGTLSWRLVKEPVTLARVEVVPNAPTGAAGSIDYSTKTIYLSKEIDRTAEREFLLAVGDALS